MWKLAGHCRWSVKFHSEHLQPQSADSGQSGQHQHIAGDDPVARHALSSSSRWQHNLSTLLTASHRCDTDGYILSRALPGPASVSELFTD
jgi:hypothetical protein